MERKPFAVGVRIEHPREMVDRSQYGRFAGHPALGAADYKLSCRPGGGRGVYTFCMCPGGEVIAAASEEGGVAVNGMSVFARDARNSNSALLVGVDLSLIHIYALPKVSTAGRRRMIAFLATIRCTPMASTMVTMAGSPSGIAATARDTAVMNMSMTAMRSIRPTMKMTAQMPSARKPRVFPS